MTITAAKLMVYVGGDTKEAEGALGGLTKLLGGVGGIAQTALGFLGGQLIMNAINGIKNLAGEALGAYSDFERLGMSLQSLVAREMVNAGQTTDLGSAMAEAGKKAEGLQGWIQKLAIESPFTQAGVADAFKTAMAYGFTTENAQRLTTAMIDFAAGSGATEGAMGQIALALGQIQAKGKLSGQEVLQLVNAGVAVDQILAKAFGKSTAEIVKMREKGLIPADEAINAIVGSLENDFGGAAKRQAGTFSGLLSSLKDIKSVGLREFFSGTFKTIQPYVQKFVDLFSSETFMANLKGIGENIGAGIGQAIVYIQDFAGRAQTAFANLASSPAIQSFAASIGNVFENLATFWEKNGARLTSMFEIYYGRIAGIIGQLASEILPWLGAQLELVSAWFIQNGPLIDAFTHKMLTAFANIAEVIAASWAFIQPLLTALIGFLLGVGKAIMQVAIGDWSGAWNTIVTAAQVAFSWLLDAFAAFANWVTTSFLGVSWASVVKTLKDDWEMLKTIGSLLWKKIVEAWNQAKVDISKFFSDIGTKINNFISSFLGPLRGAWDGISSAISTVIGWIDKVVAKLATIKIPDFLTPGSPTPFEMGLRGIGDAMQDLTKLQIPKLSYQLAGVGGGMQPVSNNANVTVNATLNRDLDLYLLAQQVAGEIRKNRF